MDDQRIEQALHDAAPVVDETRVLDRVAAKRARRRTAKRVELAAVAAVVVFAVVGLTAVVANRGGESTPHVAAPVAKTGRGSSTAVARCPATRARWSRRNR